jgi:hypothetical protein
VPWENAVDLPGAYLTFEDAGMTRPTTVLADGERVV